MECVANSGGAEIASVCDSSPECVAAVVKTHPGIAIAESLDELLDGGLDGIVIATPSAMHAEQSVRALQSNLAAAVGTIHSAGVNLQPLNHSMRSRYASESPVENVILHCN
jgi:hypothetical protein